MKGYRDVMATIFAGSDWPPRRFADHWLVEIGESCLGTSGKSIKGRDP